MTVLFSVSFLSTFLIQDPAIGHDPVPGKVCDCVGGVISPLLSNIYLTEVDAMLERAKEATQAGRYTYVEYARWADDPARPRPLF